MGDFADGDAGFDVDCGGLGVGDCGEGFELAVVEAGWFAVGGEVDGGGFYAVEFCERGYCGVPPGVGLVGGLYNWGRGGVYIFVRSSGVTPGIAGSSKIRPSRNSMI